MSAISQPIGMDAQIPSTPIAGIGQILFPSKKSPISIFIHFSLSIFLFTTHQLRDKITVVL